MLSYLVFFDGVLEKFVSVYVSRDFKLDFVRKNFKYVVMFFGELLVKVNDVSDDNFYYL